MTSHELAQKLLYGPNIPVCIYQYNGGEDVLAEVESATPEAEFEDAELVIVLRTYDPNPG